jgi:hypothetical protein
MTCEEARRIIESPRKGNRSPELSTHLATCDTCLQLLLAEALATPATTVVPPDFPDRVVFRLPQKESPRRLPRWPVVSAAGLCVLVLAAGLWLLLPHAAPPESDFWPAWYWALFLVAAAESAVLIAWAWEPVGRVDGFD